MEENGKDTLFLHLNIASIIFNGTAIVVLYFVDFSWASFPLPDMDCFWAFNVELKFLSAAPILLET